MYLNCLLQNCLWCLPWKLPYGNCHYATGCDLVILSNMICIEQCLTNFSCNLLGCKPKSPCLLGDHRKEKKEMCQNSNNWGWNNKCDHWNNQCCSCNFKQSCECCCDCCKQEHHEPKCATIKVCIEEDKKDCCC